MVLRRFYLPPEMTGAAQPEITGSDARHICRVLRLTSGDAVELFDGTGKGYRARIVTLSPTRVGLAIEAAFELLSASAIHLTLAQGMLKERKMDDLIRPLTELGIDRWMPFYAARSVPVASAKGLGARLARWEKISREAVKQCRRGCLPRITPVADLDAVIAAAVDFDLKLIFWEETPQPFDLPQPDGGTPRRILVVVGPEGGFDTGEIQRAKAKGFLTAGMGPRILRAETAALAACTLVQYCFGDMGR